MTATAPAEIRLTDPASIVAAVPHLLGYHPGDAVVTLFTASNGQGGGRLGKVSCMRTDQDMNPLHYAADMAHLAARDGYDAVVIVGYEKDCQNSAGARLALEAIFDLYGVTVTYSISVLAGLYTVNRLFGEIVTHDIPRELPDAHPAALELAVRRGSHPLANRDALAAQLRPNRRAPEVLAELDTLTDLEALAGAEMTTAWAGIFAGEPSALPARTLAVAVASLYRPTDGRARRDALIAYAAGPNPAIGTMAASDSPYLVGLPPIPEDEDEARAVRLRILDALVSLAASVNDAHVYALTGTVAWIHGDGVSAREACDHAQSIDPDHTLARLISEALDDSLSAGDVSK